MPRAYLKIRLEPFYRRDAIETGLKKLGYTIEPKTFFPKSRDDLLVLWNLKAGSEEIEAAQFELNGGTVIVMENGYLQRVDKTTYALSTHGHNGSGWFPLDYHEDRFSRLGFPIKDRADHHGRGVIVCGQRGIGSSAMRSPPGWGERTARSCNGRLRVHPGVMKPKVRLEDDLRDMKVCMIWSSACGVLALTMGLVVTYSAPRWICEEGAGLATDHEIKRALNNMAHGQWAVSEIASGEPFARMKQQGWGPRWV